MKDRLEKIRTAAEALGRSSTLETLDHIADSLAHGTYFITFAGQFSAGKSRLLNNLLQRDLLPLGVVETTPLLTYIRYGDPESACLYYLDGRCQPVSLNEVREVRQDSRKWDLENLEYIEIRINSDLLKDGLILLDTPGINTLIRRHEKLLHTSLSLALKLVFVSGGPMNAADIDALSKLADTGKELVYVQTRMDELSDAEGSAQDILNGSAQKLNGLGLSQIPQFYLSNVPDNSWFKYIADLRTYLECIGRSVQQNLRTTADRFLSQLSQELIQALKEQSHVCQLVEEKETADHSDALEQLQKEISYAEGHLKDCQHELQKKLRRYQVNMDCRIARKAEVLLDDAKLRICNSREESEQAMKALLDSEKKKLLNDILYEIRSIADEFVDFINSEAVNHIPDFIMEDIPHVEDCSALMLDQDVQFLRDKKCLAELRSNLGNVEKAMEENQPLCQKLSEAVQEAEAALLQAKNDCNSLPPYVPAYVEVEDNNAQPSEIAKQIGCILDWALLLIPGSGWAAAAEHLVPKLAKIIGGTERLNKIFKQADGIKDIAYMLNQMSKKKIRVTKKRTEKAKSLLDPVVSAAEGMHKKHNELFMDKTQDQRSLFDPLTVEYWAEKIFRTFDRTPQMVEDLEYKKQYACELEALQRKVLQSQQHEYELNKKYGFYHSRQEELEAQKSAAQINELALRDNLSQREQEIRQKAHQKAVQTWRSDCADYFSRSMNEHLQALISDQQTRTNQRITLYYTDLINRAHAQLNEKNAAYQSLTSMSVTQAHTRRIELNKLAEELMQS